MADKISIEEQVAQLSEEQQNKIIKVGKIAMATELIVGIPWLIISIIGLFVLFDPPLGLSYTDMDKVYIGFNIWLVLGAVFFIAILAFIKIKYPYYSDAKWRYINKKRKGK